MAANKRRQDEKHLKILRELGSQPNNKQCFDCHQRGPTYVNMTIGSFVCTSCSGILRGLNPPHRVKSISMTSFTPEEIEFIRSRGNEYCRRVWLGTYDSRTMAEPESKDEQRIKDFMIQKYERKRWYVDPSVAVRNVSSPLQTNTPSSASATSLPETKPLSSILGNQVRPLVVQNNQAMNSVRPLTTSTSLSSAMNSNQQPARPSLDLLSDLVGDPFASSATGQTGSHANANFANFDNFTSSGMSSPPSAGGTPMSTTSAGSQFGGFTSAGTPGSAVPPTPVSTATQNKIVSPTSQDSNVIHSAPPKDKYAALADLDNLFNSATNANPTVEWDVPPNPFSSTTQPSWTSSQSQATFSAGNPFVSGFGTQTTSTCSGTFSQFGGSSVTSPPGFGSTTPNGQLGSFAMQNGGFTNSGNGTAWPSNNTSGWVSFGSQPQQPFASHIGTFQGNKMPIVSSASVGQFNSWQPSMSNPFISGSGTLPPRGTSSNPFL